MNRRAFALALVALAGCTENLHVLSRDQPSDAAVAPDVDTPAFIATALSCGAAHSCSLSGGALSCWGENTEHALAQPDTRAREAPVPVGNATDWMAVSAGYGHTCGLRGASVYCWGAGADGRLGTGSAGPQIQPQRVLLPGPAIAIIADFEHSCALLDDGALFCWGQGDEGQLAQDDPFPGPAPDHLTPIAVAPELRFRALGTGQGHTCAVELDGALWCWGRNTGGILGIGADPPVQRRVPQRVGSASDWNAVIGGQNHNCGLRDEGSLWCWGVDGNNVDPGALGLPGTGVYYEPTQVGAASDWQQIATDTFHTCGIRGAGELWCWGRNDEGQLGAGDMLDRDEPTEVGGGADWLEVAVGRFHTCALRRDGGVWCSGMSLAGQLGAGDLQTRVEFTPVLGPVLQ